MSNEQQDAANEGMTPRDNAYFTEALNTLRNRFSSEALVRLDQTPTFLAEVRRHMYELTDKPTDTLVGTPESLSEILGEMTEDELQRIKFSERFIPGLIELMQRFAGEDVGPTKP